MQVDGEENDVIDEQNDQEEDHQPADEAGTDDSAPEDKQGDESAGNVDEPDEVVVSIGEEAPAAEEDQPAPQWVKELRKANREKDKKIRELEQKLATSQPAEKLIAVGEKPTLEGCDFDTEKFERDLETWHGRKRQAEELQRKKEDEAKAAEAAWNARLQEYEKGKTALKVSDYEDAEEVAKGLLSQTQQGIIVHGAKNSAVLIYALGKNPKKLQELAKISDPVKFAFAVAEVETQLKVQPKKSAPPPEKVVRGSGPVGGGSDATLERLRAEADKTGDRSKVAKYLRNKRAA